MNYIATLCIVLLAVYGLISLLLSIVVAGLWHARLRRVRMTSSDLFALRLSPSAGGVFLSLAVVLPAFLICEPHDGAEKVGPLLLAFALFGLGVVLAGAMRGWRASAAAAALLGSGVPADRRPIVGESTVCILDSLEPIVAVVGAWRPRIIAASCVVAALSDMEYHQVIAHEQAHISSRDNLKLLLLVVSPDALGWMSAGEDITLHWRAAAELEADARAVGSDRFKRVALAAALIKVARLLSGSKHAGPSLSMPVALDGVEGRVHLLLAPLQDFRAVRHSRILIPSALVIAVLLAPSYEFIQDCVESLVAFGR